ncbi:MAG: ubiquitin-like small modifier protein 1 [Longimonas sp.]|uniref:ubiquitin-like small modifier protein 1 n=1 Tax=Longimonas sp. TaxID=2039626 RepID=UPI003974D312
MSTPTVTFHIPTPLRSATDDQATARATGTTVGVALQNLVERYPELKSNLYTDAGELRQFVNIYVDDDDIRYLDGPDTALNEGAEVSIVPSIAGGCAR